MSEQPRLIIVRHAHRETFRGRSRDNGLSKKGRRQALTLRKFFRSRFGKDTDVVFLSSPKKRCLETLEPIAEYLGNEIEVYSALDEQESGESDRAFEHRIHKFLGEWKKSHASVMVVCSHGDWIPPAAKKLSGIPLRLSKGGWMEFTGRKKSELCWLLQRLD